MDIYTSISSLEIKRELTRTPCGNASHSMAFTVVNFKSWVAQSDVLSITRNWGDMASIGTHELVRWTDEGLPIYIGFLLGLKPDITIVRYYRAALISCQLLDGHRPCYIDKHLIYLHSFEVYISIRFCTMPNFQFAPETDIVVIGSYGTLELFAVDN